MNKTKRLYIFTGKGGVGKTTLSLSFCLNLKNQNKKCVYTYFQTSKIGSKGENQDHSVKLANQLGIETLALDLLDCSRAYIAKKLKSKTIAAWVIKTPFFQSLVNMIPGFSYVIYMGQILELMVKNPDLIVVLDSPSSGHALTMLESTKNFNEIFEDGVIYDDTNAMLSELQKDNFTKINIVTLPTLLAIHEAQELTSSIRNVHHYKTQIYCNNCLNSFDNDELPSFLKSKIENENSALKDQEEKIATELAYSMAQSPVEVIKDLVPSMQNLV